MSSITVRKMTLRDLYYVIRIANMSFPFTGRRPSVVGPYIVNRLYQDPEFQFVANLNDKIVGFITCRRENESKAELTYIAVHPAFRGKGVGKKLVRTLENSLRERGYKYLWLVTQPMAKPFYENIGYKVFRIIYRLGLEILDKTIEKTTQKLRYMTLKDAVKLASNVSDWDKMLSTFLRVYEKEPDKAIMISRDNKIIGFIISETDLYNKDFLIIKYAYYRSIEDLTKLLEATEYVASLKGYRWLGYSTEDLEMVKELKKLGWSENPLPTFMDTIFVDRSL